MGTRYLPSNAMIRVQSSGRRAVLAPWLLGLWLFTLAQGLANACLLQTEVGGQSASLRQDAGHEHEHEETGPGAAQAFCVDTCDKVQDSLQTKSAGWTGDAGPALAPAFASWQPLQHQARLARASLARAVHGPPASIRFVRLSL